MLSTIKPWPDGPSQVGSKPNRCQVANGCTTNNRSSSCSTTTMNQVNKTTRKQKCATPGSAATTKQKICRDRSATSNKIGTDAFNTSTKHKPCLFWNTYIHSRSSLLPYNILTNNSSVLTSSHWFSTKQHQLLADTNKDRYQWPYINHVVTD